MPLNKKQALFVNEYLISLNASDSARKAGYSEKTAGSIGFELLKKPDIQKAIEIQRDKIMGKLKINQEMVLDELGKIAFSRPDGIVMDFDGRLSDKLKALEMLGKYFGIFEKKESISVRFADENSCPKITADMPAKDAAKVYAQIIRGK